MYELTNSQRRCFGLPPVEPGWIRIEPKPSPYDKHTTVVYLDGTVARKIIQTGAYLYLEYELREQLSEDLRYILPKTAKGKPSLLSAATISKRTGIGMCLQFSCYESSGYTLIDLFSHTSQNCFYTSIYEPLYTGGIADFAKWVEQWCGETTSQDLADIAAFAAQPRQHQKFREGDVFRFKINRRLYGYGRVLLDYARMRKKKEPFWDILMGKPLACSVYHIATEDPDVTVEELKNLPSLPSKHMMDNKLYYGECEIIGHLPIGACEDYPIMYGGSISALYRGVLLQWGRIHRRIDGGEPLFKFFTNQGIGFSLNFQLSMLRQCIQARSNAPYWSQDTQEIRRDLRNPACRDKLRQVLQQFVLPPVDTLPSD